MAISKLPLAFFERDSWCSFFHLKITLYSPANKADFQMNGFVPGLGFDNEAYASRKGLFNFVLLLSRACNLQTAQSQTSVLNDTVYWSKFHVSGDLVTELRPTLNENISLFFSQLPAIFPTCFIWCLFLYRPVRPPSVRPYTDWLSILSSHFVPVLVSSSAVSLLGYPCIGPSKYKPPKPVTQKTHR